MYTVTLEQNNGLKNILKHSLEILLDIEDKICWGQFSCLEEITSFIIVDYTTTLPCYGEIVTCFHFEFLASMVSLQLD